MECGHHFWDTEAPEWKAIRKSKAHVYMETAKGCPECGRLVRMVTDGQTPGADYICDLAVGCGWQSGTSMGWRPGDWIPPIEVLVTKIVERPREQ